MVPRVHCHSMWSFFRRDPVRTSTRLLAGILAVRVLLFHLPLLRQVVTSLLHGCDACVIHQSPPSATTRVVGPHLHITTCESQAIYITYLIKWCHDIVKWYQQLGRILPSRYLEAEYAADHWIEKPVNLASFEQCWTFLSIGCFEWSDETKMTRILCNSEDALTSGKYQLVFASAWLNTSVFMPDYLSRQVRWISPKFDWNNNYLYLLELSVSAHTCDVIG